MEQQGISWSLHGGFPTAIHNKIRRQKVTIAMAAECSSPEGRELLQTSGVLALQGSRQLHCTNIPSSPWNSRWRSLNFSLNHTETRPSRRQSTTIHPLTLQVLKQPKSHPWLHNKKIGLALYDKKHWALKPSVGAYPSPNAFFQAVFQLWICPLAAG